MFHVKCSVCGWETNMTLSNIKKPQSCKHLDNYGFYINTQNFWKNKRLKNIFKGMKRRCYNKNDKNFSSYGAVGVDICENWLCNHTNFEDWALSNGYEENLTIDRINSKLGYCPENCRWVTAKNNAKYKSTTRILEVNGLFHTGKEWAQILGVGTNIINTMLRNNNEETVVEFIKLRLLDMSKKPKSRQSWLNIYGLE